MINKTLINDADWFPVKSEFFKWLNNRDSLLTPGLTAKPSVKVMIFLALLDSPKESNSYNDIYDIIQKQNVISGHIPQTTLRTSLISLEKTLKKANHSLQVKAIGRGFFKLTERTNEEQISTNKNNKRKSKNSSSPVILITEGLIDQEQQQKEIAYSIIEKTTVPYKALYMREWSARMWSFYAHAALEGKHRFQMECNTWQTLNIKKRLSKNNAIKKCLCFVGLAVGEGLSEIVLLQTIFADKDVQSIHYLAIDTSQRFLRGHIALIKETFSREIKEGRFLCAGVLADVLTDLKEAVDIARQEFLSNEIIFQADDFLPKDAGMLVTYFGNCLGNHPGQEMEFFSSIKSSFRNRPLEILLGVSIIGKQPDKYERSFDDFLLEMPRYLLDVAKIFESSIENNNDLPEFVLSQNNTSQKRYPEIKPEPYIVHHGIKGDIYRFYYKLDFDLNMSESFDKNCPFIKKGTSILLINIIKYNIASLVEGISKGMQFSVDYNKKNNIYLKDATKERDYTVLSAYLEE